MPSVEEAKIARGKDGRLKLKVLFVSGELIAADLAYQLKKEGCEVKLYIESQHLRDCFEGIVKKTNNWKRELSWVGKDGLIIFDDVGYGKDQDKLRKQGYLVVGGSGDGDKLELNRKYGQDILKRYGVRDKHFETKSFDIKSAIAFVKKNKGEWVIKQEGHNNSLDYVGNMQDGSDVIAMLENYKNNFGGSCRVSLQKRVRGVEIAIGRFFNGIDWIGPSVINFEHKHLFDGDIGPQGGESGTLMWYKEDENSKLFKRTFKKLKAHLQGSGYRGYIDINCIVNKDALYPLEFTCRFGSSTVEMQSELQISPWREFFTTIAKGENYQLKYKKGYGITVALTVAPFPYRTLDKNLIQSDINIIFNNNLSKEEFSHVHFEGIKSKKIKGGKYYYTAGNLGYVLYITGSGKTIQAARKKVYDIINKIMIPKMFYRSDIGLRFIQKDQKLLKKWGWI